MAIERVDVFDVGVYVVYSFIEVSHLYNMGIFLLPLLAISICCLDSTCHLLSNKLEFAQFGARMRKLWLFLSNLFFTHRLYRP